MSFLQRHWFKKTKPATKDVKELQWLLRNAHYCIRDFFCNRIDHTDKCLEWQRRHLAALGYEERP